MPKQKPNILFLFADDMRYDTIAALGNPDIITPNLDSLVRRGTSFVNAHIPGGTHAAVCMPSRAMLNTGRFLFSLEQCGETIPAGHALLGETLRGAGYRTFGTGKWHNGYESYARSFCEGAEIYFGGMYDHWKVPTYHFDPSGAYPNVVDDVMNPGYDNNNMERRCDHVSLGRHSSDLFSEAACKWLEGYEGDDPFYMYVAYMAPHDPRSMPKKYLDLYDPDQIRLPENFLTEHPFDFGVRQVRDEVLARSPRDEAEIKKHIREYYAMITHLDDTVGRIVESLKKSGRYDDTIILFAADNGLAVGQHGLMGKQNNYEHSIRVPMIFSGPGIPENETRDTYCYLMDLFPTLCGLTGTPVPETVEGISFREAIGDSGVRTRDRLFAVYEDKVRSIKDYRYKLIEYKCEDLRRTQLFDLQSDPWEKHDLAYEEEMQPVIQRLRGELRAYSERTGDAGTDEGRRYWTEYIRVRPDEWGF